MKRFTPLAWLALALALAAALWWGRPTAPLALSPPAAAAPLPALRPPPPAMAIPPRAPVATEAAPTAAPAQFAGGFCAPDDGDESFPIRRTLGRLVEEELQRRLGGLGPEARARLEQAASGDAPAAALPADEAETALLLSATRRSSATRLLQQAQELSLANPDSGALQVLTALTAESLGLPEVRLAALRRARKLLPRDPAVGWSLFAATRDSPDLDEGIDGLAAYLAVEPSAPVARLRARAVIQRDIQRDYQRQTRDGVTLLWPADALPLREADEVLGAVDRALDDAARLTGAPRRPRLTVVVYPGREELLAVSCVQSWAGGLFDGTLRLVARPEEHGVDWTALRHESLHAQLSPLAPRAPKWFHEGVAQSFAGEEARVRGQWALMARGQVWIPFASLDGSFQVFDSSSDARLAYAQSLAMVDYLRELFGDESIAELLRAFQAGDNTTAALSRALRGRELTGSLLLDFLRQRLSRD